MDGRTLAALVVTILFWASAFAGIRVGLESYSPGSLALLRFLTASVALIPLAVVRRFTMPRSKDVPFIFFSGFLGIAFYHYCLNYGEVTVTAGSAGFLIGTMPIFSVLLAVAILKESVSVRAIQGIALGFIGAALITLGEGEGAGLSLDYGALFILIASFATSLFFVLQKPYLEKYGGAEFMTYSIWAGTTFLAVFLPRLGSEIQAAPRSATLSVIYLGVFPSAVSYMTWAYALSRAPIQNVTSFMYITPALSLIIAWIWIGEIPTPIAIGGGFLALAGVALVNTGRRPGRASEASQAGVSPRN